MNKRTNERSHTENGISIGLSVSAWLTLVTNRQTHRPRYVCSSKPHIMSVAQPEIFDRERVNLYHSFLSIPVQLP